MSSELERIARLAARFGAPGDESIVQGIGDDAAVLDMQRRAFDGGGRLVWTVDAQVEGVHFRPELASWSDVGWRSFMAAASDLAAMGALPWCALSALVLPRTLDDDAIDLLTEGQRAASREIGAPVVGGNLSRGVEVSITTTLLGTCARPIHRWAVAGDGIWVSGPLGLAAAGLAALERKLDLGDADVARAVQKWRRPRARIEEGRAMGETAHVRGAIDVSDGLARDLSHVARASGLRAVIEGAALLAHIEPTLVSVARRLGASPLDLALHGGEDYALVAASPLPIEGFARIGRFEEGDGIVLEDENGNARVLDARGYDHFR